MIISKHLKLILLFFILSSHFAICQSIIRSSLNCLGSSYMDEGLILRQTAGQSSNTSLFIKDGLVLRQGFQQPLNSFNGMHELLLIDFTISPNPAFDKTLIEFVEELSQFTITLSNLNGIALIEITGESLKERWLDVKNIRSGIYIVTLNCDNGIGSKKLVITH